MGEYRSVMDAGALPFVTVQAEPGATGVFDSKFRGTPYMPRGFDYPHDPDGRPLAFLSQLNFADVPALPDFPDSGILQFYISDDINSTTQSWGLQFSRDKPYDPDAQFELQQTQNYFRVVWHDTVVSDKDLLSNETPPRTSGHMPIDGEAKLSFTPGTSYPIPDDYRFARVFGEDAYQFFERFGSQEDEVFSAYYEFITIHEIAWIGGYAYFTQTDPREVAPDEDWVLLYEIQSSMTDTQPEVLWGDAGVGAFFIRREDLRQKDFSRVLYNWDSY
jgi:uncharacterized protein YwqG